MNWDSLAAWIYKETLPDLPKLARHNIQTVYIDPRSTNAKQVVAQLEGAGITAGVYVVAGWTANASPAEFALTASKLANAAAPRTGAEAPPLMLDLEAVPKDWIAAAVTAYRSHQPARPTSYTNEPFKDGTVVPVAELVKAQMHFYPQTYLGDMTPVDTGAVCLELCRWGVPAATVHPFYDGARMPGGVRDGCVFTMERLP